MKKKIISTIVAIMIAVTGTVVGLPALKDEVHAATQEEAIAWMNAQKNNGNIPVANPAGDSSGQCVALVNKYMREVVGVSDTRGRIYQAKEMFDMNWDGFTKIAGNNNYRIGDIVVMNPYSGWVGYTGHVAIVYSTNPVRLLEQNYAGRMYPHVNDLGTRINAVRGVLRPDFLPPQPPTLEGSPIGGGNYIVSDGDYHIVSALDPNKGMDVAGARTENGTNINLYSNINDNSQVFTVKKAGEGFYSIRHKASGKSIDVQGASLKYGTNLQLYDYNNSSAQKWRIDTSDNSRYFKIRSKCNGLCIDVDNSGTANGTNIKMWGNNGEIAQQWKFIPCSAWDRQLISNGRYEIVSALSSKHCIDVQGVSKADGANIHLWTRLKKLNQLFDIRYLGDGCYEMTGVHSKKVVEVGGNVSNPGANINIYTKNGTDAQKWIIRSAGNGYYYVICKGSGLYLDAFDGKATNGTNIHGYPGNNSSAQKWKFVPVKKSVKLPGKTKIKTVKTKGNKITVTWTKAKRAKKYEVWLRRGNKKWKKACTTSKLKCTCKCKYNTKYRVKVRAINGKKKGNFSKSKQVKTKKYTVVKKLGKFKFSKYVQGKLTKRQMEYVFYSLCVYGFKGKTKALTNKDLNERLVNKYYKNPGNGVFIDLLMGVKHWYVENGFNDGSHCFKYRLHDVNKILSFFAEYKYLKNKKYPGFLHSSYTDNKYLYASVGERGYGYWQYKIKECKFNNKYMIIDLYQYDPTRASQNGGSSTLIGKFKATLTKQSNKRFKLTRIKKL